MKKQKMAPGPKSARVVVDEIFEGADARKARLLVARRLRRKKSSSLDTKYWGKEREMIMVTGLVEAFVGFPSRRKLREGDVFFITNHEKLKPGYKPIPRSVAKRIHLLVDWQESRELARSEIKRQFRELSMLQATPDRKERRILQKLVRARLKDQIKITKKLTGSGKE